MENESLAKTRFLIIIDTTLMETETTRLIMRQNISVFRAFGEEATGPSRPLRALVWDVGAT